MKKRWDEALRSLARRSRPPFRVLAYGVTSPRDGEAALVSDLENLLRSHGSGSPGEVVADLADPFVGAGQRPIFKDRVLSWIKSGGRSTAARPSGNEALEARRRLESLSADLGGFLARLDQDPAPRRPATPETDPKDRDETPLILVRQFEDLGCDAEGIAAALEAIVTRGAHLVLASEDLDTRTREGRAKVAVAIRLGAIKADRARERSLGEFQRRREGLEVYGPVPFGFTRSGKGLVPVPEQIETVARVRELSRRGTPLLETSLVLNRERRSWKDGTPFTWRRVRQILRNSIYDRTLMGVIA